MSLDDNVKALAQRLSADIKDLRTAVETGGGGPSSSGAIIDGGGPATDHTGNFKIDFGSVT